MYKCKSYSRGWRLPWPAGVRHTAWLRADRTLCSARPILSFPAKDLSRKSEKRPIQTQLRTLDDEVITVPLCLYLRADVCVRACVTHSSTLCLWRLWERRYFTWRCSGPRKSGTPQRGLWWCRFSYSWPEAGRGEIAIPRRGAQGDRMQKRKTEVTSEHKLIHLKRNEKGRKRHTN